MQTHFGPASSDGDAKEQMIAGIVKAVQPDRVFCHNSFFLVLVSNKDQKPLSDYRLQFDAIYQAPEHFNYTIINSGDLERLLVQGHLMYSAICRNECLVYKNDSSEMPLPLNQRIKKVSATALENFYAGHARARSFLEGAAFYLAKDELPLAAFMLHQAAEQLLRGAILAITGQETRSHSISELKQSLDKNGFKLPFLSSDTSVSQTLLDRLEKAYLCSRYTDKYEITREDAFRLHSLVAELLKSSKKLFEDVIMAFTEVSPQLKG